MPRPYSSVALPQLEQMLTDDYGDLDRLIAVAQELGFRSRSRARQLRERMAARISKLGGELRPVPEEFAGYQRVVLPKSRALSDVQQRVHTLEKQSPNHSSIITECQIESSEVAHSECALTSPPPKL